MRYIKIPANGKEAIVLVSTGMQDKLSYFQSEIGDYVEVVRIGHDFKTRPTRFEDVVMLVDEMGRYKSPQHLNVRASLLYGNYRHGGIIVGDAYLVGLGTENHNWGDWVSLPEEKGVEFWNDLFKREGPA